MKHPYSFFRRKSMRSILIVAGSMSVAFAIGIETAGDVQPVILPTRADANVLAGDFNASGYLDLEDVKIALELADGLRTPTPSELAADPNRDYQITTVDAMTVLEQLKRSPTKPQVEL